MANTPGSPNPRFAGANNAWLVFRSLDSYRPRFLTCDLVAGLTLAAIAIPEQMATARLGGFSPEIGFFAFLAGSLAFAFFGNNRFLSCGADSTITPIFAGGLTLLAASGSAEYAVLAAALALMVGVVLVAGGIFRLGWIADLLSIPVTIGFLAGISAHILISQLPGVLGLPSSDGPMLQRVAILAGHVNEANPITLFIGLGVLAVIAVSERINARIPGALIGLILATAAVALMGLESRGVTVLGAVFGALPTLAIPDIPAGRLARLVPLSLIIATVVMVQTAATTRSFPSDPNEPPDVDRDFVGVGAGSILSGLIGAFPVNASPPRTAIVSETSGRSQLTGLVAAAIVVALLAFGATLLRHVPHAALSGVLLFIALRIIRVRQNHRDLPAVVRRIPPDRLDHRCHHRPPDRARCRHRHRAFALERHMEHDARPRHRIRTRAGNFDLVAAEPTQPGRERAQCHSGGISGAIVFSQRISLPARHPGRLAALDAEGTADRPGGDRHSRDRLHRRPGSEGLGS